MILFDGQTFVVGVPDKIKPVKGFDGKKIRFRFRLQCAGVAFVKEVDGISQYWIDVFPDHWELNQRFAQNKRVIA